MSDVSSNLAEPKTPGRMRAGISVGAWTMADQVVVSGLSFATGLMLVRMASPGEYGAYVLAASALALITQVQSSLLLGPMAVLGSGRDVKEFRRFAAGLGVAQILVAVATALLGLGILAFLAGMGAGPSLRGAVLGATLAAPFLLIQTFCRRVLLARLMPRRALANDIAMAVLQLTLVVICTVRGVAAMSGLNMFLYAGVAAAVTCAFGGLQVRQLVTGPLSGAWAPIRESWNFGRWSLMSSLLMRGSGQAVYLILGGLAGEAAVARLEGPRLIVAPCVLAIMGWSNFVCPVAARKASRHGDAAMARFVLRATAPLVLGVLTVIAAVCLCPGRMLGGILGHAYAGETAVLIIWSFIMLAMVISTSATMILQLARRPQATLISASVGSVTGLMICPLLILAFGPRGAALTSLTIEGTVALSIALMAWRFIRKTLWQTPLNLAPVGLEAAA